MNIPRPSEIISGLIGKLIYAYNYAKEKKELTFWAVYIIAIYTPFEEFIIKWIPGPGSIAALCRMISELVLYILFGSLLYRAIFRNKPLKPTPIDPLIIAFLASTAISILINDSRIITAVGNVRTQFRYLTVYYVVVNMSLSQAHMMSLLRGISIAGLIQAALASVQYFAPAGFNKIFAPKEFWLMGIEKSSIASQGTLKVGAVAGTFGDSAVLSAFLFIPLIILITYALKNYKFVLPILPKWKPGTLYLIGILIVFFGTFATKKRAGLFLALFLPLIVLFKLKKNRIVVRVLWIVMALGMFAAFALSMSSGVDTSFEGTDARTEEIELTSYITQIFSADYWEETMEQSRGWMLKTISSSLVSSGSWFGFGPDLKVAQQHLADLQSDSFAKERLLTSDAFFDDVYWLSILAYFGIPGLVFYLMMLNRLTHTAKWLVKHAKDREHHSLGVMFSTITILAFIYCFIERIFKLRPFAFYFWLMAGLVVNCYYIEKNRNRKMAQINSLKELESTASKPSQS
jgi:hypothetical protein